MTDDQNQYPALSGPSLSDIYGLIVRKSNEQMEKQQHIAEMAEARCQLLEERVKVLERKLADRDATGSQDSSTTPSTT